MSVGVRKPLVWNYPLKAHLIRYGILAIIVLVVTHLASYQRLPFDPEYHFPWFNLMVIGAFGFTICTVNWLIYHEVSARHAGYGRSFISRLAIHLLSTFILYSILYPGVNVLIFSLEISWFGYFKYLAICSSIVVAEVAILTGFEASGIKADMRASNGKLLLKNQARSLMASIDQIAFFYSKAGVVRVYFTNGEQMTTDVGALRKFEDRLPEGQYFRINRQFLINKDCIAQATKDGKRRLLLTLKEELTIPADEIVVSRQNVGRFLRWFAVD